MDVMTENKVVPKLRFGDFEDKWKLSRLKDVSLKITDGTHDTPKTTKEGVPYLTAIHIKDGVINYDNCYYLSNADHNKIYKRCNPENGDLLLVNIGAGTATCAINIVDYEFSLKNVALIKPNRKLINEFFLEQVQRKERKKLFHRLTSGGAQPFLSLKEIGKIKLIFPSLAEQQKIASFLSAVDEKLQQLTKKKELLEEYKKGVMQKIFSQELRFKDDNGNNYPDWEVNSLGEIGETFNGLTGKTKKDFGTGKPYIQYMQIFNSARIDTSKFGYVDVKKGEKQKTAQYGDVFFTTSSEAPLEIGYASVLTEDIEELYLNSFCFGYRPNSLSELYPHFASYLFRSQALRKQIVKLAQGSTRYNMSKVQLMKVLIELPSLEEQEKIANFLSSLDSKFELVRNQIENTKAFKKGLLQQMFV